MKKFSSILSIALCLCLVLGTASLPAARAEGSAPIAQNLELTTYRGVSVGGNLTATDPDGESVVFEVTTAPIKGEVELSDDGAFVYTPADGKRGKDYFGFRAVDESGNKSQEATVIISIKKQKTKLTYSDMDGDGGHYAAVNLAENGVYTGAQLAGDYIFSPDEPISRSEFLAMCLLVSGEETLTGIETTGFSDDGSIGQWAKPYVSTALACGIISGYATDEEGAVFRPESTISLGEAAVMLDNALDLTDCVSSVKLHGAVPAWAEQSMKNLMSCSILPYSPASHDEILTRVEAAKLLSAALDFIENR